MIRLHHRAALVRAAMPVALTLLTACAPSDKRSDAVVPGTSRDSALRILSDGNPIDSARIPPPGALVPASDTLRNVWRRSVYLLRGQKFEVLFYSPTNEKWRPADTIPKDPVIPVLVVDGKVAAVGKRDYERAAKDVGLPVRPY